MFVPCFFVQCYVTIILMRTRELVALLCFIFWFLVTVIVLFLFLTVLWIGLQCEFVDFPDDTHFFTVENIN